MKAILIAAVLAAAGSAHADGLASTPPPMMSTRANAAVAALDFSANQSASPFAQAAALRGAGIAKTSVDRRFGPKDTTGSFGFLCGLQPGVEKSGAAGAFGYDPNGRFLGAKLSFAFR